MRQVSPPDKPKIFLSYSAQDKNTARAIHRLLVDGGVEVWFDEERLIPGQRWDAALTKALRASDVILLLIGRSATGKAQSIEIRKALERSAVDPNVRLVPVLLPGSTVEDLPPSLQ